MSIDRREFLKTATAGAGLALAKPTQSVADETASPAPRRTSQSPDVVVVGAGAFGAWTALHLARSGASVTLVDQYGPGNSRATSGGATRGVRSSYGGRNHGALWTRWAKEAIEEWKQWDAKWDAHHPRLFFQTGDLILRDEWAPLMEDSRNEWDAQGATYEILDPGEIKKRWPVIDVSEVRVGLYEPGAGVVRARRAIEAVADELRAEGGTVMEGTAVLGDLDGPTIDELQLASGDRLSADAYVLALGPWFPKALPRLMAQRLRVGTVGHVFYYGTPVGDERYRYPNLPSFNVPGVTGWPALGRDFRGFRVRTGAHRDDDPDASVRWIPERDLRRPRAILEMYFPGLADMPLLETRACHYESSVDRNFFIDRHPGFDNVWLAGGGSAEGFKFGPKVGHYAAQRVLGIDDDPELREAFALKEQVFEEGD